MNKGAKGISCTHLVKNNVFPLVLGDYLIVGNKCKRSDKFTFYGPCHVTSAKEGYHLGFHACKPCHRSKGGTPWRIRGQHVDILWIEGPAATQTASKSSGHLEPTQGPTGQPPRESTGRGMPTRGRLTPQVGWTDLVSAHPILSHGASWLITHSIPGMFAAIPHQCSGL
jgi:hypothetical protein